MRLKVAVTSCALALLALASGCTPLGSQQGYTPEQPVNYSHAVHAGQYGMDCQYCHFAAERSRHAGVPHVTLCMNCHTLVKNDSPEVAKLAAAWEKDEPIQWVKVHRLPDHVFFSHASHVTAEVKCQTCHGPVETMAKVTQVETMTMGWCLDCHRTTREQSVKAADALAAAAREPRPVALLASAGASLPLPTPAPAPRLLMPPTDCSGCHR